MVIKPKSWYAAHYAVSPDVFFSFLSHQIKTSEASGLPLGGICSAPVQPAKACGGPGFCPPVPTAPGSELPARPAPGSLPSWRGRAAAPRASRYSLLTGALGVVALPALGPGPSALGAAVGRRCALPAPLLRAVGAGHRALAPGAPLLPLSVDCRGRHKREGHSRVTTQAWLLSALGGFSLGLNATPWTESSLKTLDFWQQSSIGIVILSYFKIVSSCFHFSLSQECFMPSNYTLI